MVYIFYALAVIYFYQYYTSKDDTIGEVRMLIFFWGFLLLAVIVGLH